MAAWNDSLYRSQIEKVLKQIPTTTSSTEAFRMKIFKSLVDSGYVWPPCKTPINIESHYNVSILNP